MCTRLGWYLCRNWQLAVDSFDWPALGHALHLAHLLLLVDYNFAFDDSTSHFSCFLANFFFHLIENEKKKLKLPVPKIEQNSTKSWLLWAKLILTITIKIRSGDQKWKFKSQEHS